MEKKSTVKSETHDITPDDSRNYLDIVNTLKSIKSNHVSNAETALKEYLNFECGGIYDPLKTIVDQWVLQVLPALPTPEVIGVDDTGMRNSETINRTLESTIRRDNTYIKFRDMVMNWFLKSGGYIYEFIAEEYSGTELVYYWPRSRIIPYSQLVYNGNTLDESSIVAFWDYYTKDEFKSMQASAYNLSDTELNNVFDKAFDWESMACDDEWRVIQQNDKVSLTHIYDTALDRYFAMANGVWVNSINGTIAQNPFKHKQAPVAEFIPYTVPWVQYGTSIATITNPLRQIYKNLQKKELEIIDKLEGWDIVSPDAIWDWQTNKQIRENHGVVVANPNEYAHETPNIQNFSYLLSEKQDCLNQMADLVWYSYQSLETRKYENAKATVARTSAITRTIEHIVRQALTQVYSRWITQRLSNLQYLYDVKKKPLMAYWMSYNQVSVADLLGDDTFADILDDVEINIETSAQKTVMEVKIEEIEWLVEVFPDVDPILSGSSEQQFLMMKEVIWYLWQLPSESGQSLLTQESMIGMFAPMFPKLKLKSLIKNKYVPEENLARDMGIAPPVVEDPTSAGWVPQEFTVQWWGTGWSIV